MSEFWKMHMPLYVILIASLVFLYFAKSPLYWELFISTYTILLTIVFCIWYGPKDEKSPVGQE